MGTRCPYAAAFPCRKTSSVPPIFSKCCPNLISIKIIIFSFCHPKHSKISKIKIFYLLGEPYLFIVLPIKQKLAFMAFFLLFPPSLKKKQQIFSVFGDYSSDLKSENNTFDLKSIFFCLYVFFNL